MSSTICGSVLGWLTWSLIHYALHRAWHIAMRSGWSSAPWVEGEKTHHERYDHTTGPIDTHDPFISFPLHIASIVVITTSLTLMVTGQPPGLLYGYLYGAFLCMAIDDTIHRMGHNTDKPVRWSVVRWAQRLHRVHHDTHRYNFSVFTGVLWDVLFGTYKNHV